MGIVKILYSIIINPLVLVFDVIFSITLNHLRYVGWSVVILSFIINTLVLPLYNRADEMQARESKRKKELKKWEDHIKKHFKGDERFMMLQTYYRQNDYKPYQTLRGALPLILEVPFFIAAYHYLSSLSVFSGYSFGPIKDLSVPDHMLSIGGISINVLPIIMTLINIISSLVYNRTTSFKNKIQLYIVALVFLVLLYNSPSALVLYWTCNNIYSLLKNIVYRFFIKDKYVDRVNHKSVDDSDKDINRVFVGSSILMAILVGSYIPCSLILDSFEEFISFNFLNNPALYVVNSFCIAFGLFFIWAGVYFVLARKKAKTIIAAVMLIMCVCGFAFYSVIPFDSPITMFLTIDTPTTSTKIIVLQCVAILISISILVCLLLKSKKNAVGHILIFILLTFVVYNSYSIYKIYNCSSEKIKQLKEYDNYPEIHLSKNGKNVVVIMMDRMISYYVPFLINEKPELKEKFDGFTYYPNCTSYGIATNVGVPALFGGYEYVPEKINERKNETLKEKHNEALKVMPVMFGQNGFDVTVGNPSYANYDWIADLSIYDDYPYIYKYNSGAKMNPQNIYYSYEDVINRNLVCYGIYRSAPIFLQSLLYDNARYNSLLVSSTNGVGICSFTSLSESQGISELFYNDYNMLNGLSDISILDDDNMNHFNMFSNNTTHEAVMLQEPDCYLCSVVDNTEYDKEHSIKKSSDGNELNLYDYSEGSSFSVDSFELERVMMYHSNMATMLILAKWFDYMRENDVYDNTRIIIVSDHGYPLEFKKDLACVLSFENGEAEAYDVLAAHSTLLVKDFNSKGFTTDNSFMTNADVPTIASKDLIDNPINPFSGNAIDSKDKNGENKIIYTSTWDINDNNGYTYKKSHWFSVHDNIFDNNNWNYLGAY